MRLLYEVGMCQVPTQGEEYEKLLAEAKEAHSSLCPHCDEDFYDEAAGYCEACGYEDE